MPHLVQPFELLVLTIIATLSVAVRSAGAVPHQGDLSSGSGTRRQLGSSGEPVLATGTMDARPEPLLDLE
eukprot:COSAG06_NODE_57951_length_278_cov_1.407821_1_plen_69_part_01